MYLLSLLLIYFVHDRVGVASIGQNEHSKIALRNRHGKYIELFVVVDHLTFSYHGDDTENYVIEMLKTVADLWDSPTLGVDIGLLLTGIEILSEPHPLIRDVEDANAILMDFRRWLTRDQSRYLDLNFDVAIFITRKNIHIDSNYEATGKGFVGGTCIEDMKMAIVEDVSPVGLVTSIAHELGHLLGMYHDYQYSNAQCPDETFIMSGLAVWGLKSMQWSSCSGDAIQRFIEGRRANCLNEHGTGGEVMVGDHMTGMRYSASFQCTMLRGQKSLSCYRTDMCSQLFCRSTSDSIDMCVTDHRPPLDGTKCGENKWCQKGLCVDEPIPIELLTNKPNMDIKRFGVTALSTGKNANRVLDILWKVTLVFATFVVFKQFMNITRMCSSNVLHRVRNGQIQIV